MTNRLTEERLDQIAVDMLGSFTSEMRAMATELLELRNEVHNESHRCGCVFYENRPVTECFYHLELRKEVEWLRKAHYDSCNWFED